MISNKLINFRDEVLVAIDARKRASLYASVVRQVFDEMSGAFVNNTLHSQLPCGEVNVFYLRENKSANVLREKCYMALID